MIGVIAVALGAGVIYVGVRILGRGSCDCVVKPICVGRGLSSGGALPMARMTLLSPEILR